MPPRSRPGSHGKASSEELLAFGANGDGQCGFADRAITSSVARSAALLPRVREVRQAACGASHVCVLTASGDAVVAGANDYGQLGTGDLVARQAPLHVRALSGLVVTQVSCGDQHTLLLAAPGHVWAFGSNYAGQLGLGIEAARGKHATPKALTRGNVRGVVCGGNHSILLLGDPSDGPACAVAFGSNAFGQLGSGRDGGHDEGAGVPIKVSAKVESAAAGRYHTLLIIEGGVWGCGRNVSGQLGLGPGGLKGAVTTPMLLETLAPGSLPGVGDKVVQVACGARHSLALSRNGCVWAFGDNTSGQLGLGLIASFAPELFASPRRVEQFIQDVTGDASYGKS
ncbi:regulator of chromosome condensation 1/beta-lactamase-inhibitor protein II [Baffinella frigidus]|nr:regulator of chromosome condensation 1/beta-lactamase-inhibitor protein II [Cryptophyta sp. CCMP2293]